MYSLTMPILFGETVRLFFNFISHSPHGFDESGVSVWLAQLLAQTSDVHHDGVVAVEIFLAPHLFKNLLRRHHIPAIFAEQS